MGDLEHAEGGRSGPREVPPTAPAGPEYGSDPGPAAAPSVQGAASARGDALTALITSSVLIISCVGFLTVPAAILAAVALSRADRDPDDCRKLLRMAWIAMAAGLWITLWLVIVVYDLRIHRLEGDPYFLYQ